MNLERIFQRLDTIQDPNQSEATVRQQILFLSGNVGAAIANVEPLDELLSRMRDDGYEVDAPFHPSDDVPDREYAMRMLFDLSHRHQVGLEQAQDILLWIEPSTRTTIKREISEKAQRVDAILRPPIHPNPDCSAIGDFSELGVRSIHSRDSTLVFDALGWITAIRANSEEKAQRPTVPTTLANMIATVGRTAYDVLSSGYSTLRNLRSMERQHALFRESTACRDYVRSLLCDENRFTYDQAYGNPEVAFDLWKHGIFGQWSGEPEVWGLTQGAVDAIRTAHVPVPPSSAGFQAIAADPKLCDD